MIWFIVNGTQIFGEYILRGVWGRVLVAKPHFSRESLLEELGQELLVCQIFRETEFNWYRGIVITY